MVFQQNLLEKAYFIAKMSGLAMVPVQYNKLPKNVSFCSYFYVLSGLSLD